MRTFGIWVFGLLASAMIGGMVAHYFMGTEMDVFGGLTGMAVFACARLWLASPSQKTI
jgi:hypothetical protein